METEEFCEGGFEKKEKQILLDKHLSMFKRYFMISAYGNIGENKTEMKYVANFDAPHFYERKLRLVLNTVNHGKSEMGEIPFNLDRNKAMGNMLKRSIDKTVNAGRSDIHFDTILATPTKTVIKGSVQRIFELGMDKIRGERLRPIGLNVELIADGKVLPQQGGRMTTDIRGITFEMGYDVLPKGLKQLQMRFVSFAADYDAHSVFDIQKGKSNGTVKVNNQSVQIGDVYEAKGDTYVTITTEDDVILTRVKLITDDAVRNLEKTIDSRQDKKPDGVITHTRTLHFKGTGEKLKHDVRRITYTEAINKVIDIPVD